MGVRPVDLHVLRALRNRPNSETDSLATRLRRDAEVVEDQLDTLVRLGLARRGTLTHLWNISQLGRALIERLERDSPIERAIEQMMRHNAGLQRS